MLTPTTFIAIQIEVRKVEAAALRLILVPDQAQTGRFFFPVYPLTIFTQNILPSRCHKQ